MGVWGGGVLSLVRPSVCMQHNFLDTVVVARLMCFVGFMHFFFFWGGVILGPTVRKFGLRYSVSSSQRNN